MEALHRLDRAVMKDIEDRTGQVFRSVDAIDTSMEAVARAVLPILAEWVPVALPNYRTAIYGRFHTKHARPYLRQMVTWLHGETERLGIDSLYQCITLVVHPSDGEWLWQELPNLPHSWGDYYLLAKLAECPAVASEIKDRLVHDLQTKDLFGGQLLAISKVDDRRIFKWFEDHVNSRDTGIGPIARRVVNRGKPLQGVEFAASPPNPIGALVSAEMDVADLPEFLRQVVKEHSLTIPASVRKGSFLTRIPVDRWVVLPVKSKKVDCLNLYFRLEDIDVVEIALVSADPPVSTPVN